MSHGNRWSSVSSKLSLSTRFVCARTSFSTNFLLRLLFLWEWIHPSIDQQCSRADAEHMTPETLHTNQASSFHGGSPVLRSVTPSRNFSIEVVWGSFSISGVKESTKSVVLDLVIKTILYTQCCQLRLCRYVYHPVYQERLFITLLYHLLGSDQWEIPFQGFVHYHREDVRGSLIFDELAQKITNELHCFVLTWWGFRLHQESHWWWDVRL
jgi:hypothetical protein